MYLIFWLAFGAVMLIKAALEKWLLKDPEKAFEAIRFMFNGWLLLSIYNAFSKITF